jgi:hypothetical protein
VLFRSDQQAAGCPIINRHDGISIKKNCEMAIPRAEKGHQPDGRPPNQVFMSQFIVSPDLPKQVLRLCDRSLGCVNIALGQGTAGFDAPIRQDLIDPVCCVGTNSQTGECQCHPVGF